MNVTPESRQKARLLLMLAPPTLVLGVLFLAALLAALLQSFGYAPIYGIDTFPTLRYYSKLFDSSGFW